MRIFINLLITAGLLLLLSAFGWLTLKNNGVAVDINHLTWPIFGSVVLVAFIVWAIGLLVHALYLILSCFTFGLMIFAYPFLGWATLELIAHFMPDTLVLNGFWITAFCGFLLMIVRFHPKSGREDEDD